MSSPRTISIKNRLSWILATVILASIVIPALVIGVYEITSKSQASLSEQTQQDAQALMRVLTRGLDPALWSFLPENAVHLIEGIALNPAVNKIVVNDHIGGRFAEYYKIGYTQESDALKLSDTIYHDGEAIGDVLLEYSLQPAKLAAEEEARQFLMITAGQATLTFSVILIFLNFRVTRPLSQVKAFAHEIARKNFDATFTAKHADEFSSLADELEQMKLALRDAFERLEERVQQRTHDLILLNQELTDAVMRLETAKDNLVQTEKLAALGALVAGVSHELNTPIGNARVMSTTLYDNAKQLKRHFEAGKMTKTGFESSIDEILDGAQLIERNLMKSVNLVQSFKNIAVDRTSDVRRTFSLHEFIHEIQSTMQHIFKVKPYTLDVQLGDDVELDTYPGVLSQILSNLINNALMHGLEGLETGTVKITSRLNGERLALTVSDNGHGMDEITQKRIFEPFFTTKMGKGGSGLGMHIVHNLTTGALGGELSIDSVRDQGTTITLVIPTTAPEQSTAKNSQRSANN